MKHPSEPDVKETIRLCGLIPQVCAEEAKDALRVLSALKKGGVAAVELVWRGDATRDMLKQASKELPSLLLGVADILSAEAAKQAAEAGAAYVATPGLLPDVANGCGRIPVLPGCATLSEADAAAQFGFDLIRVDPVTAGEGSALLRRLSQAYPSLGLMPASEWTPEDAVACLALPGVAACVGRRFDGSEADEEIENWARQMIQTILGFNLAHVGINSGSEALAFEQAAAFCKLLDWPMRPGGSSAFAGKIVEFVKTPWSGTHGHIAVGVRNIRRAWWYMERRGVRFDWENAKCKGDRLVALYLPEEIGGFSVHLLQQ